VTDFRVPEPYGVGDPTRRALDALKVYVDNKVAAGGGPGGSAVLDGGDPSTSASSFVDGGSP
jgi:hypothetical protein